jgi:hypothetical protein
MSGNNSMIKPSGLILLGLVALVCSLASAQQAQPQPAVAAAAAAAPTPPANATCTTSSTKPNTAPESHVFATCIVTKFSAYLSVAPNKFVELKNGKVESSNTTKSHCENSNNASASNPKLVVAFDCAELELEFEKFNETGVEVYAVKSINGQFTYDNETVIFTNATGSMFKTTTAGRYYKCNSEQNVVNAGGQQQLVLSNLAYEVYRTASGTDFYRLPEECALDSSSVNDLVRIGVGICLVALIALVLVAYFVGRRRWSERSSYESV